MSYSINDLIEEINNILPDVEKELNDRKNAINGDGNIIKLTHMIEELNEIKTKALNNEVPVKKDRYTIFPYHIVDEWDVHSLLGHRLSKLAGHYKRELD